MSDLLETVESFLAELPYELEARAEGGVYRLRERPDQDGHRRAVYVHVTDEPPLVKVWAPVLQGVSSCAEAALLRAGTELPAAKLCWYADQAAVTLDAALVGTDLTLRQLDEALGLVAFLSRRAADELQGEVGGEVPEVSG